MTSPVPPCAGVLVGARVGLGVTVGVRVRVWVEVGVGGKGVGVRVKVGVLEATIVFVAVGVLVIVALLTGVLVGLARTGVEVDEGDTILVDVAAPAVEVEVGEVVFVGVAVAKQTFGAEAELWGVIDAPKCTAKSRLLLSESAQSSPFLEAELVLLSAPVGPAPS